MRPSFYPLFFSSLRPYLAKGRRHLFDLLSRLRLDLLDRGEKVRMRHAGTEISPAHPLQHRSGHLFSMALRKIPPGGVDKTLDVELGLLFDTVVEKRADFGVFLKPLVDLFAGAIRRNRLQDQGVELGML